ncbi:MAG: DUF4367 domain-containing protein [Oscillospiraceae bacterium]|jgi:hypothetical protein|nr:DUF4367 domain-containing protein [Oscillospiraceae bacterium]
MLADDTLLPLDDPSNTDKILEILAIIRRKENKPAELREAERSAFWTRLLDRYGDQLPFRLEDVVRPREGKTSNGDAGSQASRTRFGRRLSWHRIGRRFAAVAVLVTALLLVNTLVAYAFQVNILSAVVPFTDDLFHKTVVVSTVDTPGSVGPPQGSRVNGGSTLLQTALDELGITQPNAPGWMPSGFVFDNLQVADAQSCKILAAQYKRGKEAITLTFALYDQPLTELTRTHEKSTGTPLEYERDGIIHYIFNNFDVTVVTWFDGVCDCDIQGNISVKEMKSIIDSMY